MMEHGHKRPRVLCFARDIKKFISDFPDLQCRGTVIYCSVCQYYLHGCMTASDCRRHIATARHTQNSKLKFPYCLFICDLLLMFSVCGIPQWILENNHFRSFWKKYNSEWPLPTRQQLRWEFPHAKRRLEEKIKNELRDKKIWVTVDETTDARKNHVGNVLVRVLDSTKVSKLYLIASRRLEKTSSETIQELVRSALNKFGVQPHNVFMLLSDGAAYMRKASQMLKTIYPNLIHVTCLLHALHNVAEEIRKCYTDVDKLISSTKMVFVKSPQRIKTFHEKCPGIREPPEPVLTRWGTWLNAAFYYNEHFEKVKSVIDSFNPKESTFIQNSQEVFNKRQVKEDLYIIHKNYSILSNALQTLQTSLTLSQSLEVVDQVQLALQTLTDDFGVRVSNKFQAVLRKNPGIKQLHEINTRISDGSASDIDLYFTYANITSLDVERSFSKYTLTFAPKRRSLSENSMEALLMMQVYADHNKDPFMAQE